MRVKKIRHRRAWVVPSNHICFSFFFLFPSPSCSFPSYYPGQFSNKSLTRVQEHTARVVHQNIRLLLPNQNKSWWWSREIHQFDEQCMAKENKTISWCVRMRVCMCVSVCVCVSACFDNRFYIREAASMVVVGLSAQLLALQLIFLLGVRQTDKKSLCKAVGLLLHYFLLSSLCWSAVKAFLLHRKIIKVFNIEVSHFLLKALSFSQGEVRAIEKNTKEDG